MPLPVKEADVGSNPIAHPKHEMIGSNPRRAVRTEDHTLTTGKDSISINICSSGSDGSCAGLKHQILGFDSLGLHQFKEAP